MSDALATVKAAVDAACRQVSIEALAGRATKLTRGRGACPLPGCRAVAKPAEGGVRKRKKKALRSEPFEVRDGRFHCYKCGEGGDVVDLERALRGGSILEAARRLAGMTELPKPSRPPVRARAEGGRSETTARIAAEIWRAARPAAGTAVEAYLAARCIVPGVIAAAVRNLRFHPAAKWWFDDGSRRWVTAPAMIALVVVAGPDGRPVAPGGIHATYLAPGGSGKAESDHAPSKIMWGPQSLDGRPGGAWLIGPSLEGHAGDGLAIGAEGIESSLSLASLHLMRTGSLPRAWAALSLDRLQGRLLKDDDRRIDAWAPQPDPEKPAFVWPGVPRVMIGVDRDMSPLTLKARSRRRRPCEVTLDAEARARLCARLSAQAWKAAGAQSATAVAPAPGRDFNDELRARKGPEGRVAA